MKRQQLINALKELLGNDWFLRTTEAFNGSKGGIWTTNERTSNALDGQTIMEEYEVHPKVEALVKQHGFFVEPYDAGTLMIYPE